MMTERSNEELFEAQFSIAVEDIPQTYNSNYECPEYKTGCPECGGKDRLSIFGGTHKILARCWGKDQGRQGCGKVYLREEFLDLEKEKETVHEKPPKSPKKKTYETKPQDYLVFIEKAHSVILDEKHQKALKYALSRGFTEELIKKYKIGAVLDPQKGPGLVLPVFQPAVYFQIRWINWDKTCSYGKYQNPKGKKISYAVFGEIKNKKAFLVESLIDAMLINEATGKTGIAFMGAKDTLQATALFEDVFYIPDTDEAGENVAKDISKDHWIFLPEGFKDAGELIQEKGISWTAEYLKIFTERPPPEKSIPPKAPAKEPKTKSVPKDKSKKPKIETAPIPECNYSYITTKEEAESIVAKFKEITGAIALDTETTGLDCFNDRIRLLQIYHPKLGCFLFDLFKIGESKFLKPLEEKHFVIHNASFDVKMLRSAGIELKSFEDTLLIAALTWPIPHPKDGKRKNLEMVPGAIKERKFSLFHLLKLFLGVELNKSKKLRVGWEEDEIPKEKLDYAALDVLHLLKIYGILQEKIKKKGLDTVYAIYRKSVEGFIEMEYLGAPVQKKALEKALEDLNPKKEKTRLQKRYNIENINSNKQLTEHIEKHFAKQAKKLERTGKSKQISLSKSSLKQIIKQSKEPEKEFFEAIQNLKTQSTIYREHEKLLKAINKKTGRVHASYRVLQASSGRTLTADPNFQGQSSNVKAFIGVNEDSGKSILSADYSQQELRVFALKTNNKKLLAQLEAGNDGYKAVAAAVLGKSAEEITKEERKLFKMVTLAVLYGKGSRTLAQDLGVKQQEAAEKLEKLQETLDVGRVQGDLEYEHEAAGRISTVFGSVKRPILDKWKTLNSYQLINYFIQGTAANIGILAFEKLRKSLPKSARLIGYIHDEFLIEISRDVNEAAIQETVTQAMQDAFIECFSQAENQREYLVEVSISNHWIKD